MNPMNRTGKGELLREGPIYDRSVRTTTEDNPGAFCDWLGEPRDEEVKVISSSFTAETLHADFVGQVAPDRLIHAEYISDPRRETAVRMVAYRAQLMRSHPACSIKQYALVLAGGRLPSVDDPPAGFVHGLRTIYLRDCDPAELLAYPSLGGLAVLANGNSETRAHALKEAIRGIQELPEDRQNRLIDAMAVLATIHLEPSTINQITKESTEERTMTIETVIEFYSQTDLGQAFIRKGREQGREQCSATMLTVLLQSRFGEQAQIPTIAEHLAQSRDDKASIRIVTEAASLDDLAGWLVPTQPTQQTEPAEPAQPTEA